MAMLPRPDGVELYWEERGEGPLVVVALLFYSPPPRVEELVAELSGDHRVVTYDLRGNGRSSRRGPYEIATDAEDLVALVEAAGAPATVVATGDGANRAVRAAAGRPDLITTVVQAGNSPLGRRAGAGEALAGSASVLQGLVTLLESDYRAALRNMFMSAGGATTSGDEFRELIDLTVAYCPQESMTARMREWIADEAIDTASALGDRLLVLQYDDGNQWFSAEALVRARELLPEARFQSVTDGPFSRPLETAAIVRALTTRA